MIDLELASQPELLEQVVDRGRSSADEGRFEPILRGVSSIGVGQRSRSESVVKIFQALLSQRTWRQPDLARHLEIHVNALKKLLAELETEGLPLIREEESRTDVYWSVPKGWFPGGAVFTGEELDVLLRQLACLPEGTDRDRLMETAARCLAGKNELAERLRQIVVAPSFAEDERIFPLLIEAAERRTPVRCRYYSGSTGRDSRRHVSVHRVLPGPPRRIIATCHLSGQLKWFRVDNVLSAELDPAETFREATTDAIAALVDGTVDGFHAGGPSTEHRFFVPNPDARWVAKNLPDGMHAVETDSGVRVTATTAATVHVARYVLGLGGLGRPETPELARMVADLARRALAQAESIGTSDRPVTA